MADVKKVEFVYGEINFSQLKDDVLDELLEKISPNYDKLEFNLYGKRKRAFKICTRMDIKTLDEVDEKLFARQAKIETGIPDEFVQLSRDEISDLMLRSGMKYKIEEYEDHQIWKLKSALSRYCAKQNITLAELKLQEPSSGVGRGIPIPFEINRPIPTAAPNGVSEGAAKILEILVKAAEAENIEIKIGRNKSEKPLAMAIYNDSRVFISMPDEYALEGRAKKSK
ncbi:MAG: hypothetical protein WC998_00785 [Candidatus Paceibacterota bacterium]|jgi:hypothetical protein